MQVRWRLRQPVEIAVNLYRHRHAAPAREVPALPPQRRTQAEFVQHGRPQAHWPGRALRGWSRHSGGGRRPGAPAACPAGAMRRFQVAEFHGHGGEHLADGVVEFPRERSTLLFLSPHQVPGKPAQFLLRAFRAFALLFAAAFENGHTRRADQRHQQAEPEREQDRPRRKLCISFWLSSSRCCSVRRCAALISLISRASVTTASRRGSTCWRRKIWLSAAFSCGDQLQDGIHRFPIGLQFRLQLLNQLGGSLLPPAAAPEDPAADGWKSAWPTAAPGRRAP